MTGVVFPPRGSYKDVELGEIFSPKFDAQGLIPAVAVDAATGEVLMLAYMNDQALALTISTGEAHYWSRSRGELWRKGATSGNRQRVVELATDCDQDAVVVKVVMEGDGAACHTGRRTCFYRAVSGLGEDGGGAPAALVYKT